MTSPSREPPEAGEATARSTRAGLVGAIALLAFGFLAFATQYVPHLTNNMWSDAEFTGWGAAIAHRVASGERMFRELVFPIPPGSFWLLAWVERITGRAACLHELWLCAFCHLGMGLVAYALASMFASRLTSLFVAASSLALVVQLHKELAYDHTAQLVAWIALALLARGLVAWRSASRDRWLAVAGFAAGLVHLFKQSTGLGAMAGGVVAIALLAWLDRRSDPRAFRRGARSLAAFALPSLAGFGLVLASIEAMGGSAALFVQTVFRDGSALKGGPVVIVPRLLGYTTVDPTLQVPLLVVAAGVLAALRIARTRRAFVAPSPSGSRDAELAPPTAAELTGFALVVGGTFALGILLLALRVKQVLLPFHLAYLVGQYAPELGLLFGAGYVVVRLRDREGPVERADAMGAVLVASLAASLFHNASVPEVRPFYDNNAVIAVCVLYLFVALEQAKLPILRWGVFAIVFASLLGGKMQRFLDARIVVRDGFWGGLVVSERGKTIVDAALRVRELAGPDDEVLVLPEDVTFAALVDRPRPKLCGAILFVDQYPRRCLAHDLLEFEKHPPKVVVIYPGWENEWRRMYHLWSDRSPAGFFNHAVLHYYLPAHFKFDSTYASMFWSYPSKLDVFVRKTEDEEKEGRERAEKAKEERNEGEGEGEHADAHGRDADEAPRKP